MVVLKELYRLSKKAEEYINITEEVHQLIRESGVKNGIAAVITSHTTTGIFVNEALPCVESDISDMLEKSAPLNETYAHAHFLPDYGATGNNSQGHRQSLRLSGHRRGDRLRRRSGNLSGGIRRPSETTGICRSDGRSLIADAAEGLPIRTASRLSGMERFSI